jgi:enamine deaminase RidA (YjgF/YER057c/UK114 family)
MLQPLNPTSISPPFANYSHGVAVPNEGTLVLTSGQLAQHKDGSVPADASAQAELCFKNIEAILAEAHATVEHVVKINAFVTDRSHMQAYMAARDAWLSGIKNLPASTLMIVGGFTRPEFLVEVEVIAMLPVR